MEIGSCVYATRSISAQAWESRSAAALFVGDEEMHGEGDGGHDAAYDQRKARPPAATLVQLPADRERDTFGSRFRASPASVPATIH